MEKEKVFTVDVNREHYYVEPVVNDVNKRTEFKVSTNCGYMFTLCMNDAGGWEIEKDIIPLYGNLVKDIGLAIEHHEA